MAWRAGGGDDQRGPAVTRKGRNSNGRATPDQDSVAEAPDQVHGQAAEAGLVGAEGLPDWDDLPLNPDHVEMLVASGISPERARRRGYESMAAWEAARMEEEFGFSKRAANRVPGLLIPRLGVDGQVWGYQFRPDSSVRPDNDQTAKYETRHGDPNGVDVPPGVDADMLSSPASRCGSPRASRRVTVVRSAGCASSMSPGCGTGSGETARAARSHCLTGTISRSTTAR